MADGAEVGTEAEAEASAEVTVIAKGERAGTVRYVLTLA